MVGMEGVGGCGRSGWCGTGRGSPVWTLSLQIQVKKEQVAEARAELRKARAEHKAQGDGKSRR